MRVFAQSAYRPDIDGLRAIAVLAVIVFHINKHLLPGGFVGVDIFFVISGYLISQHIMRDIERDRFSLIDFYRRRVKRLALPLLLVVSLTLLTAFLLMLPEDFKQTANSGLFSLVSLANVFFWLFQDTSYFAADSNALPLLHLWSLGVEEQFYILWPLLLMFTYRSARTKIFFVLASVFALASFAFGEFWFQHDASFVYYMLPSRAGELLAGALVAMAVLRGIENRLSKKISTGIAVIGIALIFISLCWLNEDQVFPGMRAILPTAGAALLILAGHCAKNRVSNLLASPALVWLGLISYSAYLWHWPILAFLRYEHVNIGFVAGVIVLLVTLWWSFLSYMLVELPAREWDAIPSRIFLFQYIVPACLVAFLAFSGKHILVSGASMPAPSDAMSASAQSSVQADTVSGGQVMPDAKVNQTTNAPLADTGSVKQANNVIKTMSEIDTQLHETPLPAYQFDYVCQRERITSADTHNPHCVLGGGDDVPPRVVLWGDSHAAHFIGVVGTIAKAAGFKFRNIELDACPPLMDDPAPYVVAKRLADCRNSSETISELVRRADVVIISATWSDYFAKSNGYLDATFNMIRQLTSAGKFVIIMGKAPVIMSFDRSCKDKAQHSGLPIDCTFNEPLSAEVINANNQLKSFAEHTPNVSYFDVIRYMCKDGMCSASDVAGNPLYYDAGHLSMPGSWKIGESIVRQEGVPKAFMNVTTWLKKTEQK